MMWKVQTVVESMVASIANHPNLLRTDCYMCKQCMLFLGGWWRLHQIEVEVLPPLAKSLVYNYITD